MPNSKQITMRYLLLPLLAALALPTAAKAESHWLIIQHTGSYTPTLEKVEMPSAEACEKEGRRWEDSPTQGDKSSYRRFHCVIGK